MAVKLKHRAQTFMARTLYSHIHKRVSGKSPEQIDRYAVSLGHRITMMTPVLKQRVVKALTHLFPERAGDRELLRNILDRQTGRLITDALLAFESRSLQEFPYPVRFEGFERLQDIYDRGQGVILTTGHFGNWEVFLQALTWKGLSLTAIQRQHRNASLNEFLTQKRSASGASVIDYHRRSTASFRQCIRELKEGRALGLLVDVVTKNRKVDVSFLGKTFPAPMGPAMLAQMTQAMIVPGYCLRTDGGYTVVLNEPIDPPESKERIAEVTQLIMDDLESGIRNNVEQWCWYLRRWGEIPFNS